MKQKKISLMFLVLMISLVFTSVSFAEYGPGDPDAPPPETETIETSDPNATGPEVVEYYDYSIDRHKVYEPGSLSSDVNFTFVGRGLYFDEQDFYFFLDTGIMATNYMYNMEGDRFYFGEDGKMVRDDMVYHNDEMYYFDQNGAMLRDSWLTLSEYDPYEKTTEYTTYYFGRTGRAYKAASGQGVVLKEIEGDKYGFNEEGELLKGFVDEYGYELDPENEYAYEQCLFYFDPADEYAAYGGWFDYEWTNIDEQYENYDLLVLYFDPKTKRKVKSANNERYLNRTIDDERYIFDSNGVRVTNWSGAVKATNSNVRYFNEEYDGYLSKGWFMAVPSEDSLLDRNREYNSSNEEQWYYATRNGSVLRKCIRKIGMRTYAFDEDGVMQADRLVVVENGEYIRSYDISELTYKDVVYGYDEGGILHNGEQWMYFTGGRENEDMEGAMCNVGQKVELSLKDGDVYFYCNNTGGFSNKDVTSAVSRTGTFIQNGVILAADTGVGKYGIIRENRTSELDIPNYKNWEGIDIGDKSGYKYWVVNKQGKKVNSQNACIKDGMGNFIYLGPSGIFMGCFSVEGKYVNGAWKYRDENDKKIWHDTFPPITYKLDPEELFINFETLDNSLSEYIYDSP